MRTSVTRSPNICHLFEYLSCLQYSTSHTRAPPSACFFVSEHSRRQNRRTQNLDRTTTNEQRRTNFGLYYQGAPTRPRKRRLHVDSKSAARPPQGRRFTNADAVGLE